MFFTSVSAHIPQSGTTSADGARLGAGLQRAGSEQHLAAHLRQSSCSMLRDGGGACSGERRAATPVSAEALSAAAHSQLLLLQMLQMMMVLEVMVMMELSSRTTRTG